MLWTPVLKTNRASTYEDSDVPAGKIGGWEGDKGCAWPDTFGASQAIQELPVSEGLILDLAGGCEALRGDDSHKPWLLPSPPPLATVLLQVPRLAIWPWVPSKMFWYGAVCIHVG